jgi:hypothetical protein
MLARAIEPPEKELMSRPEKRILSKSSLSDWGSGLPARCTVSGGPARDAQSVAFAMLTKGPALSGSSSFWHRRLTVTGNP